MNKQYSLNSIDSGYGPVEFSFDYETQKAAGRDSDTINEMVRQAVDGGAIPTHVVCFNYPVGDSLDEAEMGMLLSFYWDTSKDFPELVIPEELLEVPDYPGVVS